MKAAGYAESDSYATDLISIINKYDLKQYDKKKTLMNNKYIQIAMAAITIIFAANIIYRNL